MASNKWIISDYWCQQTPVSMYATSFLWPHFWSFVFERSILGDYAKAHNLDFTWNLANFMWNPADFMTSTWKPCKSNKKNSSVSWSAVGRLCLMISLPDFSKSARFHEIRNERPIARNDKAYVWDVFSITNYDTIDLYFVFLILVHCFYVKIRDFMLEWSPSLPLKMPRCLDLVNKLCSINNSSIHWKLTLSYWCHAMINYGDLGMIDNSLRNHVSGYLCYILAWKVQPLKTHICTELQRASHLCQHIFCILVFYDGGVQLCSKL